MDAVIFDEQRDAQGKLLLNRYRRVFIGGQ